MTFNHSTRAQLLVRLRRRYLRASQVDAIRIGAWLYNNLTLAQVQNLFNVTLTEAQTIQSRLQAQATRLAALQNAAGE